MKSAELLILYDLLRASFSLNQYQGDMLSFLLANGEANVKGIIKGTEMPRARIYDTADFLERNGFIEIKKRVKLDKPNEHSHLHRTYVKPKVTKYIPFDLQTIIKNQKKQKQLQLNEKFKVMDRFKIDIKKQITTLINTKSNKEVKNG